MDNLCRYCGATQKFPTSEHPFQAALTTDGVPVGESRCTDGRACAERTPHKLPSSSCERAGHQTGMTRGDFVKLVEADPKLAAAVDTAIGAGEALDSGIKYEDLSIAQQVAMTYVKMAMDGGVTEETDVFVAALEERLKRAYAEVNPEMAPLATSDDVQ